MNRKQELRQLMWAAGLTNLEVAKALDVTERIVRYWVSEKSTRMPPQVALMAIKWSLAHNPKVRICWAPILDEPAVSSRL